MLRPLLARDRGPLATLLRSVESFGEAEVEVALELIDEVIARGPATSYRVLVAIGDDEDEPLLGYVCFGATPMTETTFDLYWIVVDPRARGRGVAGVLCAALEHHVRDAGGKNIRVETSSQDEYTAATRFYRRQGFEERGRIPDFYRIGEDLLTFVKRV